MNGEQFLVTARLLLKQHEGTDEAAYRSSINRAYYACFITIRDLAYKVCSSEKRRQGQIKKAKNIGHQTLQFWLKNASVEAVRQLGEDLSAFSTNRNDADYDMEVAISANDAKDAVEQAEIILEALSRISPEEIKKTVEDYIQKFNRKA